MDKELLRVTLGFVMLMAIPGLVIGLNIKIHSGVMITLPIGLLIVGIILMLPMMRDNKPKSEVVQQ